MKNKHPTTIEINPTGSPDASIIWLHGLGADGQDFVAIADRFKFPKDHKTRFVFPHAPLRRITVNGGMMMRGWYDITSLTVNQVEDSPGIRESAVQLESMIEHEIKLGIDSKRIVLGGFSQGGALALFTGLRYSKPLGGLVVLSSYMPLSNTLTAEGNTINQTMPIFMAHGRFDPIVPWGLGENARKQLEDLGYPLEWHGYSMQHTVLAEEIDDLAIFLKKILFIESNLR